MDVSLSGAGSQASKKLAGTYGRVKGVDVELVRAGSQAELEALALRLRSESDVKYYYSYAIHLIHLFTLKRAWALENLWESSKIQRTTLDDAVLLKSPL